MGISKPQNYLYVPKAKVKDLTIMSQYYREHKI